MHGAGTINVQFRAASDQSLIIYLGHQITLEAHQQVVKLLKLLQADPIEGVRNLHPAYCSLLVKFDSLRLGHDELRAKLQSYLNRIKKTPLPTPRSAVG